MPKLPKAAPLTLEELAVRAGKLSTAAGAHDARSAAALVLIAQTLILILQEMQMRD